MPAHLVGQQPHQRDHHGGHQRAQGDGFQRLRLLIAQGGGGVADHKGGEDIEGGGLHHFQTRGDQHFPPVVFERLAQRSLRHLARLFHLLKGGRFVDVFADPQAEENEDGAEQERNAPAPGEKLRLIEQGHQRDDEGCHQHADGHAGLGNTAEKAFPLFRGVFVGQQQRAAPFAADTHALNNAQGNQQGRRPQAHHLVGGQQANGHRGAAHQRQGEHQRLLATDAIADMGENDSADGADKKGERKGEPGEDQTNDRVDHRKEDFVKHQRGGGAIEKIIEPFDGAAGQARDQYLLVFLQNGCSVACWIAHYETFSRHGKRSGVTLCVQGAT